MAGIFVQNSLKVLTQNGECQIDLCIGDITLLDHKDKVDVIMVSAFRGNYVPSPTSVIGALERNLDISVHTLAQDKAEDLRKLYSCWWSKPLPENKPFNRLLCFEAASGRGRPQQLVANVYRCLVPILNNEDGTVITPLLNTGDQGYGEVSMLEGMVVAAINWMKAGLPLRLLKIVLYAKLEDGKVVNTAEVKDGILRKTAVKNFDKVCEKFTDLKGRYDSQYLVPRAVPIEYDVYLSYSKEDAAVAEMIQEKLKADKTDIKIFGEKQELDKEAVWQQDMYQVMMRSARVVTVLTPNYLKCTECVEQYNIALCCNRRARRDMLAPIYIDTIDAMPTYMGLVQYIDCRPNDAGKIQEACSTLLHSMTTKVHLEVPVVDAAPIQYDIFLSYCHKDDTKANHIVKVLQEANPNLRVFFDMNELKTGNAWQRTLYHSIDGSRYLIALISENYMKSAVCQEEYNLALAKHCSHNGSMQLIPLCIEDVQEVPAKFSKVNMVKATSDVFEEAVTVVCKELVSNLGGKEGGQETKQIISKDAISSCNLHKIHEEQRRANFMKKYGTLEKKPQSIEKSYLSRLQNLMDTSESTSNMSEAEDVIVFSCSQEDCKYAQFLQVILKDAAPDLVTKIAINSDQKRLSLMDSARCVVPFLSPSYLDSPEQVEEFNIALCRQRNSRNTVIFPVIVHTLPWKPMYFHIVACPVDITDALWVELAHIWSTYDPNKLMVLETRFNVKSMPAEVMLGLHEAANILIGLLKAEDSSKAPDDGTYFSRPVLHNVRLIQDETETKGSSEPVQLDKILTNLTLKE